MDESPAMPPQPPAPPARRRRAVSLRVAMCCLVLLALALGWFKHRVDVRREGVDIIRRHGGMYYYDFEYTEDYQFPSPPKSGWPAWIVRQVGVDAFHHVTWVRIESPVFDDDDLRRLMACQPGIRTMGLRGTAITDEGLSCFRGNRRIGGLFLESCPLTDKGMEHLAPETTPALELIAVRGTQVTDAKAAELQSLLEAREAAVRASNPGLRVSTHMVLTGRPAPPFLSGADPRGRYEAEGASTGGRAE